MHIAYASFCSLAHLSGAGSVWSRRRCAPGARLTGGHATVTAAGVAVSSWCNSSLLHRTAAANGQDAGRPLFSSCTCWLLRLVMSNLAQGSQPTNFNWADPSSWSQSGAKGSAASHLAHKASLAGRVLVLAALVSCVSIPLHTAASLPKACRRRSRREIGRLRGKIVHVVHVARLSLQILRSLVGQRADGAVLVGPRESCRESDGGREMEMK